MKSRTQILLAFLLAAFMGGLCWITFGKGEREPLYKGKPLSYWLQGFGPRSSKDPMPEEPTAGEASAAVRWLGTNAIPPLLRMLRMHDSPLATRLYRLTLKQHFLHIHYIPCLDRVYQSQRAFSLLGTNAMSAMPQLIEIFHQNPNPFSEREIPLILAGILADADASKALPALTLMIRAATGSDASVRNCAVLALCQMRREPALVVPALTKSLGDTNALTRLNAAMGLGGFGEDARPAVPALLKLLAEPPTNSATPWPTPAYSLSNAAAYALKQINLEGWSSEGSK